METEIYIKVISCMSEAHVWKALVHVWVIQVAELPDSTWVTSDSWLSLDCNTSVHSSGTQSTQTGARLGCTTQAWPMQDSKLFQTVPACSWVFLGLPGNTNEVTHRFLRFSNFNKVSPTSTESAILQLQLQVELKDSKHLFSSLNLNLTVFSLSVNMLVTGLP